MTIDTRKSPREFWVYEDNGDIWVYEINWNDQSPKGIHVIEYDAYQELANAQTNYLKNAIANNHLLIVKDAELEAIRKELEELKQKVASQCLRLEAIARSSNVSANSGVVIQLVANDLDRAYRRISQQDDELEALRKERDELVLDLAHCGGLIKTLEKERDEYRAVLDWMEVGYGGMFGSDSITKEDEAYDLCADKVFEVLAKYPKESI
jgi:hypothetical protein